MSVKLVCMYLWFFGCVCVCLSVCLCVCVYLCMFSRLYVCLCQSASMCVSVSACIYVCLSLSACMYFIFWATASSCSHLYFLKWLRKICIMRCETKNCTHKFKFLITNACKNILQKSFFALKFLGNIRKCHKKTVKLRKSEIKRLFSRGLFIKYLVNMWCCLNSAVGVWSALTIRFSSL